MRTDTNKDLIEDQIEAENAAHKFLSWANRYVAPGAGSMNNGLSFAIAVGNKRINLDDEMTRCFHGDHKLLAQAVKQVQLDCFW